MAITGKPGSGALAALALAALALLASCGGSGSNSESAAPATASPAGFNTIVTAATGAAQVDGRFESVRGYLSQGRTVLRGDGQTAQKALFKLQVPQTGYYEVFAWWPQAAPGSGVVRAELRHSRGRSGQDVDQSSDGGQWNSLGVYPLAAGDAASSLTFSAGGGTRLYADAVRVQWVDAERPALRLASDGLPVADKDDDYDGRLAAWGGVAPFSYRLVEGALPDGLRLDARTGRISGVPAQAGSFTLHVAVTDGEGRQARGELALEVALSRDLPSSVRPGPFRLQGDARKTRLSVGAATGADLGNLPAIVRAMPEGGWAKVNLNLFSDAWVPAELRPLYGKGNPTPAKIITAWSSFAWDSNRGNLMLYGGGHANYLGNEVYLWRGATQKWERASLPSTQVQDALGNWGAIDGADAAPASAHTYDNTLFLPQIDRLVVVGGAANNGGHYLRIGSNGLTRSTGLYLFDPSRAHPDRVGGTTGSHVQREGPYPEIVGGQMWTNRESYLNAVGDFPPGASWVNGCSAVGRENGRDVAILRSVGEVFKLTITDPSNPLSDVWQRVGRKWNGSGSKATCAYDSDQQLLLRTATQTVPFVYWPLANATPHTRDVNVVPADPSGSFMPALADGSVNIANCGLEFDPLRRNYKLWCGGGGVWQLTPPATVSASGWSIVPLVPTTAALPDATVTNGVLGKWKYIENLDVFMALQDSVQGNIWIYKPAGWVDPGGGSANQPPVASLTQPLAGASFTQGTAIALSATASDPDGSVVRVEFFNGSTRLGEARAVPYALNWTDAPAGRHSLTARVTDDRGASGTSAAIDITVTAPGNLPPAVTLGEPVSNAVFAAGQPVALSADATDADGSVVRVDFYAGRLKIGEASSSPFRFGWSGAPAGSHVLTAIAHDDDGAQTVSQPVSITVSPASGGSQTVTFQRGLHPGPGIADTYLSSYSESRNFGSADSMLELSKYNILLRAAIFQSEGGPVPNGATIESAVLSVYKWSSAAMTYGLHRVLQPWTESGSTWNERLPGVPWGAPGGKVADVDYAAAPSALASVGYDPGWLSFDVTAGVQQISTTVLVVNNGWRIHPAASGSSLKRFHTSEFLGDAHLRPKLVVTYR